MEQEAVMSGKYVKVDDVMELINTSNRGSCDYFIVDQIEELCRSEKNIRSGQGCGRAGQAGR